MGDWSIKERRGGGGTKNPICRVDEYFGFFMTIK